MAQAPTQQPPQAAAPYAPTLLQSAPGIQRDGTRLSQTQYIGGVWTRFYQSLPRKMLGYREQLRTLNGIARALDVESYDGFSYIHAGQPNVLQRYTINNQTGLPSGLIDRTPVAFTADDYNNWQFSVMYDTTNDANLFFAHAAPNIMDISNTTNRSIYFGEVRDIAQMQERVASGPTASTDIYQVSGGVVSIWPYLVWFGNDGFVGWSPPGQPLATSGTGSGTARPCGNKIVRAMPLRGTSGPAALLWSLDALVYMQFVGGTLVFNFTTLTTSSAILSSNSVIEHEGVYYWATVSGFAQFNGVIRTLKNTDNEQFFLENLNYAHRQKVFAVKVPRWGEIWWCAPMFGATECNWAFVYNYNEGYWYDTPLPAGGRSAGMYEQVYHYPIMTSASPNIDTGTYSTWQHEFGLDEVSGAVPISRAIRAFIQTNEFNIVAPKQIGQQGMDKNQSFSLLEPDFNQVGDLTFQIWSRQNARATQRMTVEEIIPANPASNQELVKLKHTGRLNSFMVISNTLGGNFIFGSPLIHWLPSDGRRQD